MSKPFCGPAFPCMDSAVINKIGMSATLDLPETASVHERDKVYIQATAKAAQGMSLRDYFAAKAMQGWTSNPLPNDSSIQDVAAWAYRQADAMLAARSA
ncbi:hypothetical protein HZF02_26695 [Pseudomonas yamanorum]|nr:hypothetical protein HZF02_26695 [Pseudomonas yamanorum]